MCSLKVIENKTLIEEKATKLIRLERHFWEGGGTGSTRSLSLPRQQLHWKSLCNVTVLEVWSLLKSSKAPWGGKAGVLYSISAISTGAITHFPLHCLGG